IGDELREDAALPDAVEQPRRVPVGGNHAGRDYCGEVVAPTKEAPGTRLGCFTEAIGTPSARRSWGADSPASGRKGLCRPSGGNRPERVALGLTRRRGFRSRFFRRSTDPTERDDGQSRPSGAPAPEPPRERAPSIRRRATPTRQPTRTDRQTDR